MADIRITVEPGVPQVLFTRELDAPREFVYRAYTEPELLVQWFGPRGVTMTIDRFEPRDGGTWRYTHTGDDGTPYAFHGVFHGTPSIDGIVQTFEFEGWPGHVSLDTVTFEDRQGGTLVRANSVFQSVENRDAMVRAGMETGIREGFERLDELIGRELKARHDTDR